MNLRDVVRPVGADASPDEWVLPVVIYPATVIGDGSDTTAITVALAAGETHIGEVGGKMSRVNTTLTRPSDTTAYAAKDAVAATSPAFLTFANLARVNDGGGYIVKARLTTNLSTDTKRYRLHLYRTTGTAIADNAQFTLLDAAKGVKIGYIDFPACATEGTGSDCAEAANDTLRLAFVCSGGVAHIYGMLQTLDAGTPASAQTYHIELMADLN